LKTTPFSVTGTQTLKTQTIKIWHLCSFSVPLWKCQKNSQGFSSNTVLWGRPNSYEWIKFSI
jgi:hypothetical protein